MTKLPVSIKFSDTIFSCLDAYRLAEGRDHPPLDTVEPGCYSRVASLTTLVLRSAVLAKVPLQGFTWGTKSWRFKIAVDTRASYMVMH